MFRRSVFPRTVAVLFLAVSLLSSHGGLVSASRPCYDCQKILDSPVGRVIFETPLPVPAARKIGKTSLVEEEGIEIRHSNKYENTVNNGENSGIDGEREKGGEGRSLHHSDPDSLGVDANALSPAPAEIDSFISTTNNNNNNNNYNIDNIDSNDNNDDVADNDNDDDEIGNADILASDYSLKSGHSEDSLVSLFCDNPAISGQNSAKSGHENKAKNGHENKGENGGLSGACSAFLRAYGAEKVKKAVVGLGAHRARERGAARVACVRIGACDANPSFAGVARDFGRAKSLAESTEKPAEKTAEKTAGKGVKKGVKKDAEGVKKDAEGVKKDGDKAKARSSKSRGKAVSRHRSVSPGGSFHSGEAIPKLGSLDGKTHSEGSKGKNRSKKKNESGLKTGGGKAKGTKSAKKPAKSASKSASKSALKSASKTAAKSAKIGKKAAEKIKDRDAMDAAGRSGSGVGDIRPSKKEKKPSAEKSANQKAKKPKSEDMRLEEVSQSISRQENNADRYAAILSIP